VRKWIVIFSLIRHQGYGSSSAKLRDPGTEGVSLGSAYCAVRQAKMDFSKRLSDPYTELNIGIRFTVLYRHLDGYYHYIGGRHYEYHQTILDWLYVVFLGAIEIDYLKPGSRIFTNAMEIY
jgi:hypothetical protein